ncbi:unnamed protein product [Toxocara canis]|uniref:EB domain-containing protein n=1 Tax=Toxocara canis TaxID=6265 RepID=A0A183U7R7_TOXCA|nr:unnamed protein product [Toxocara canis]
MTGASTTTYLPTATTVLTRSKLPISTAASVSEETSTQKEGSSEDRYPPTDVKDRHIGRNVQTTFTMATTTSKVRTLVVSNHGIGNLATTTKLSEDEDSCALLNGVLCQFGCASREKCECPESSHVTAVNGACVQRTMKTTSSTCLAKRDVNATWDSRLRALHIYSREVTFCA